MGSENGVAAPRRLDVAVAWLVAACFVGYYAIYIYRHSDFNNDDLDNFLLLRRANFLGYLLTPTDVHFVPLHRLLSWVVYHVAPMDFRVAVAVLSLFHVGTLVYLWRTCRLLSLGETGYLFVAGYAASCLAVFGMLWWAHAQHRAPYVFFDVLAIYHYLVWLRRGGWRHLAVPAVAMLLAMGCYEKAVLIPVHMLVIGWLTREPSYGREAWRAIKPILALLALSALYVVLYLWLHQNKVADQVAQLRSIEMAALASFDQESDKLRELTAMDPAQLRWRLLLLSGQTELEFFKQLMGVLSGVSSEGQRDLPFGGLAWRGWLALGLTGAFAAFSLWRYPRTWNVLLAFFVLLSLDFAPIAFSNRGTVLGMHTAHFERFLYEELHIVVLLGMAWWWQVLRAEPELRTHRPAFVTALAVVLAYGALNVSNLHAAARTEWGMLWMMQHGHEYAHNLRRDLSGIREPNPSFENSDVPSFMSLFRIIPDTRTLLPLYRPDAHFDLPNAAFRVAEDGKIVRLSANARPAP